MTKQGKPTRAAMARKKVEAAFESLAYARGEAQWMHGYRTGGKDSEETCAKELGWWRLVGKREGEAKRALAAYRRAILADAKR